MRVPVKIQGRREGFSYTEVQGVKGVSLARWMASRGSADAPIARRSRHLRRREVAAEEIVHLRNRTDRRGAGESAMNRGGKREG